MARQPLTIALINAASGRGFRQMYPEGTAANFVDYQIGKLSNIDGTIDACEKWEAQWDAFPKCRKIVLCNEYFFISSVAGWLVIRILNT
jgi:hypothetical protein